MRLEINTCAGVAQLEEQLTCNQQVAGSSPIAGSIIIRDKVRRILVIQADNLIFAKYFNVEGFPSGQREQTVNLPVSPSQVRILPPPPKFLYLGKSCRGVEQLAARRAHNPKVVGSNPTPATNAAVAQ